MAISSRCGQASAVMMFILSLLVSIVGYAESCPNGSVIDFAMAVPPSDPESTTPPPPSNLPKLVTAGTSSSAPNLSATVVIEKHDQSEDTNQQVPLGDLYCGIQTKNTTSVKIGSFQNKCILYDGLKAGNDSPVTLSSKTVISLSGGSKTTTHHSFTLKDPSYYTLYGCVNTGSSPPKETTISDNCGTRTFLAYGVPDVAVEEVYIQGGGTAFLRGSTPMVVADVGNSGDNFHAGKNRQMTIAAELSGCVSSRIEDAVEIDDGVLHKGDHGKTKMFSVSVPLDAVGTCTVTIIADPKGELQQEPNRESNRSNNSMAITFQVSEPEPFVPCNVITAQNWVSGGWSGLGYAAPFTANGTQVVNAFCKEHDTHALKVVVGDPNNPSMISALTGYVESKTTGAFLAQTLTCSGAVNGSWCQGTATFEVSDVGIDTTTAVDPTKFYGATCEVVNSAWQCPGWRLGAAGR